MEIKYSYIRSRLIFPDHIDWADEYDSVDSPAELADAFRTAFKTRKGVRDMAVTCFVPGNRRGIAVSPKYDDPDVFVIETYSGLEYVSRRKAASWVWDYVQQHAQKPEQVPEIA